MKNHFTIRPNLTIASLILLLSGCASDPEPAPAPLLSGEEMLRESQGIASLGDRWKQGKQMVDRGNALVAEGQSKIDEGRRMIAEGEKVMRESEENYKKIKK